MEKREPSCAVGGNVYRFSHSGKHMEVPQKLKNRMCKLKKKKILEQNTVSENK